jgi:prepilin-type N-terminal cleavage/methylation domain-containing protein
MLARFKKSTCRGFTVLEVLIAVTIIAIIAGFSFINLFGNRNTALLSSTASEIGISLRQAESNAVSQSKGASWGMYFDNTVPANAFYKFFYTSSTYASSTQAGYYDLPAGICYATSSIASGATSTIIFSAPSGASSASTTIVLQLMTGAGCGGNIAASTSIGVSALGQITY